MKQLQAYAVGHGISLFQAMAEAGMVTGLSTKAAAGAKKFVDLVRRWRRLAGMDPAGTVEGRRRGGEGETRRHGDKGTRRGGGGDAAVFRRDARLWSGGRCGR